MRTVPSEGNLKTYYLKVDPVYAEKTGSTQPDCRTAPTKDYPVDAIINLVFYVTDPVTTMEIESVTGDWIPAPVGNGSWEYQLRLAHAMGEPKFQFFANGYWPGLPGLADFFVATSKIWKYSGGTLFADVPYTRDIDGSNGKLTERTLLELYFAPKPLRDSDTKLPPAQTSHPLSQ